jgi:hypothetical protein
MTISTYAKSNIKSETVNIIIASDLSYIINTHFNVSNYNITDDFEEDFYFNSTGELYIKYEVTTEMYWTGKNMHNTTIKRFKEGYEYKDITDTLLKQLCIDGVLSPGTYFIRIY